MIEGNKHTMNRIISKNYTKHTHTGAQTHTGGTPIDKKRSNTTSNTTNTNANANANANADADADANTPRLMIQTLSTLSNRTETSSSPIRIHIESLIQCMIRSEGTRLQYQMIKKDWIIKRMMQMQLQLHKRECSRQCYRQCYRSLSRRQRSRQLADISISTSTSCGIEDEVNLHLQKEEVQGLSTENINIPASNTSATSTVVSVVSIPQPSLPLKRISYCSIRHDRRKKYTRRKVGSK